VFCPPLVVLGSENGHSVVNENINELVLHLFGGCCYPACNLLSSFMALVLCSQDLNQVRLDHLPDVLEVNHAMFFQKMFHSDLPLDQDDYSVTFMGFEILFLLNSII
jgi:hypothetical protein